MIKRKENKTQRERRLAKSRRYYLARVARKNLEEQLKQQEKILGANDGTFTGIIAVTNEGIAYLTTNRIHQGQKEKITMGIEDRKTLERSEEPTLQIDHETTEKIPKKRIKKPKIDDGKPKVVRPKIEDPEKLEIRREKDRIYKHKKRHPEWFTPSELEKKPRIPKPKRERPKKPKKEPVVVKKESVKRVKPPPPPPPKMPRPYPRERDFAAANTRKFKKMSYTLPRKLPPLSVAKIIPLNKEKKPKKMINRRNKMILRSSNNKKIKTPKIYIYKEAVKCGKRGRPRLADDQERRANQKEELLRKLERRRKEKMAENTASLNKPRTENKERPESGRVFRVRDFVYVENGPSLPYRIGQIQSFKPGVSSGVYARVRFYERARDVDVNQLRRLTSIAEKFMYSIDFGKRNFSAEMDRQTREAMWHQFKLREVIGNRNCPAEGEECFVNASLIRGKCAVFRYLNIETISDYLEKPDTFFYLAAFDDNPRKLAIEGEVVPSRSERLARIADLEALGLGTLNGAKSKDSDTGDFMVWDGKIAKVSEEDFDKFLMVVRSVGVFGRAFDHSRRVTDSSIQSTVAYTFRDATKYMAHFLLHASGYDVAKATAMLQAELSPLVCTDQLELWSEDDVLYFYDEIKKTKRFSDIRRKNYTWKSVKEMVEFYYMNKVTELYVGLKKDRADRKLSTVSQIRVPLEDTSVLQFALSRAPDNPVCEGCRATNSSRWFSWARTLVLCTECWMHWKKYGGLLAPHNSDGIRALDSAMLCDVCLIPFVNRRRYNRHMSSHYAYSCDEPSCHRKFSTPELAEMHRIQIHGNVKKIPDASAVQNIFLFFAGPRWRTVRRELCQYAVNPRALCRKRAYTFDRCIANFEGRVPPVSPRGPTKRLSDVFAFVRKRSTSAVGLVDEPPRKMSNNS